MLDYAASIRAEVRFIEYMDVAGATKWSADTVLSAPRDARPAARDIRRARRPSTTPGRRPRPTGTRCPTGGCSGSSRQPPNRSAGIAIARASPQTACSSRASTRPTAWTSGRGSGRARRRRTWPRRWMPGGRAGRTAAPKNGWECADRTRLRARQRASRQPASRNAQARRLKPSAPLWCQAQNGAFPRQDAPFWA